MGRTLTLTRDMVVIAALMCGGLLAPAAHSAGHACRDACFKAKSMEYQRCRTIPPSDRGRRLRCFQTADQALHRCLHACR